MQAEIVNKGIQYRLTEWAAWANSGTRNISPMQQLLNHISGTVLGAADMSDEDGGRIDDAVRSLASYEPERAEIIKLYYLHYLSDGAVGRKLRMTRHRARNQRLAAENWLDGALSQKSY